MKVKYTLALLLALLACGCAVRYQGRELLNLDPDVDVWMHHPQAPTNVPAPSFP